MRELGVITKIKDNIATVKVNKNDECSKCGMCLFPKGASSVDFEAENAVSAKMGDTVIIETQKEGKLLGATLAFLVPLLLIGLALLLNYLVIFNELISLGVALGLIAVWYVVLAFIDKKLKKAVGFSAKVVEIVLNSQDEQQNPDQNIENKEEKI